MDGAGNRERSGPCVQPSDQIFKSRILCRGLLHFGDRGLPFALTFRRATGYSDRIKRDATFPNCEQYLKSENVLQTLKDIN